MWNGLPSFLFSPLFLKLVVGDVKKKSSRYYMYLGSENFRLVLIFKSLDENSFFTFDSEFFTSALPHKEITSYFPTPKCLLIFVFTL